MDFNSILNEMEKERKKAFDIKKDKHSDNHEAQEVHGQHEEVDEEHDTEETENIEESGEDEEEHDEEEHNEEQRKRHDGVASIIDGDFGGHGTKHRAETSETIETTQTIHTSKIDDHGSEEHKTESEHETESKQEQETKPQKESNKQSSRSTDSQLIKQKKDVINMPKKTEKIVKTTIIEETVKHSADEAGVTKHKTSGKSSSMKKKLAKVNKKYDEVKKKIKPIIAKKKKVNHISKKRSMIKTVGLVTRKALEDKANQIKKASLYNKKEVTKLKKEMTKLKTGVDNLSKKEKLFANKDAVEKEKQKLNQELDKLRKDVAHIKELDPHTLLSSVQRLNENIAEMNSLFRLATELMQKPDPIQGKLNKLFGENEKIAQGIISVLDVVNELKEAGAKEGKELKAIEEEIKIPLREIASRKKEDFSAPPTIPAPPADFMDDENHMDEPLPNAISPPDASAFAPLGAEDSDDFSSMDLSSPPTMTPMPSVDGLPAPTPIAAPNVMPPSSIGRASAFNSKTGGPILRNDALPSDLPPSPTQFTADQLDQLAGQSFGPSGAPMVASRPFRQPSGASMSVHPPGSLPNMQSAPQRNISGRSLRSRAQLNI
ncbi:MAG: hypothetical protein ABIG89_01710 [Candidatus Woesearchaeota archaeon]